MEVYGNHGPMEEHTIFKEGRRMWDNDNKGSLLIRIIPKNFSRKALDGKQLQRKSF